MKKEDIKTIEKYIYLENGNRASYIDIDSDEADRFIKAIENLLNEKKSIFQEIDEALKYQAIASNEYWKEKIEGEIQVIKYKNEMRFRNKEGIPDYTFKQIEVLEKLLGE